MLSIYFEEMSAYQYRQRKEHEGRLNGNGGSGGGEKAQIVEDFCIPDEEEEDE